jgi:hypothetical protein
MFWPSRVNHFTVLCHERHRLAELVLKSGQAQDLQLNGVRQAEKIGLQISSAAPWLAGVSSNNVLIALRSKLGDLVDEILVEGEKPPIIYLVMWLNESNREGRQFEGDDEGDEG